jgi:hydrogenase/urease accessory protein HupE
MSTATRIVLACLSVLLFGRLAGAHEIRPAYLQITENDQHRFDILWKQPAMGTLAVRLVPAVSNGLLDVPADEESAGNSFLLRRWSNRPQTRDSFDGATIRVEGIEHTITDVLVVVSFANGQEIQAILKPTDPSLIVHLRGAGKAAVATYLNLGIEHILTGFDHLSFVLGLVLLVRGRATLLKTITAFTLAHSITLATAALGYVNVSAPVIESLVALSIVFVAVELARSYCGEVGLTARYPWLIAFTFGLLHGFAFAGSLAEIGLPPHNIPGALVLFNCGVEAGQLMFVAVVLVLLAVTRRLFGQLLPWTRWVAPYAIGSLASYWMIQRIDVIVSRSM